MTNWSLGVLKPLPPPREVVDVFLIFFVLRGRTIKPCMRHETDGINGF